jgi:hypothetical protein
MGHTTAGGSKCSFRRDCAQGGSSAPGFVLQTPVSSVVLPFYEERVMLKRGRAVPMCFPTIFFACLLLTTCGHAQGGVRLQRVEISANDPARILQILLESQRVLTRDDQRSASRTLGAGLESWVSKLAVLVQRDSPRSGSEPLRIVPVAATASYPDIRLAKYDSGEVISTVDPALWSGMTPGKIFGIGAQSAH